MALRCTVRDRMTVSKREITPQGYMVAPAVIGRCGIQEYLRSELGLDGDPDAVVRLMRTPDEVFRPETIASFENVPLTYRHPDSGVDASNWPELSKGHVRDVAKLPADLLGGTVWVMDAQQVARVASGDVDLSCGYGFDLDLAPGVAADGQAFDGYQRNILGDHLAILDRSVDSPRGGPVCRIGDKQQKENVMKRIVQSKDGLVVVGEFEEPQATAVQNMLDSILGQRDQAVNDFATFKKKTAKDLAEAVGAKDAAIAEKDKTIAARDADIVRLNSALAAAKAIDVDALVTEKTEVVTDAKKIAPTLDAKGTPAQIRRAALTVAAGDAINKVVIESHVGADGIEKASDDKVKAAFDLLTKISRDAIVVAQDRAVAAAASGNTIVAVTDGGEVFGDEDEEKASA
jgi:uncharacterized protein